MIAGGIMIPFLGLVALLGPRMGTNSFQANAIALKTACTDAVEVLERVTPNLVEAKVDLQPRFGANASRYAYSLSDEVAGLECQADVRNGRGSVTHIIINGKDVTKEYRLKEQN